MHVIQAQWTIERTLSGIIQEHYPLDWKEDPITHRLMIELRNHFRSTTLHGVRGREAGTQLEWEVYKFHGKQETAYGDIGLLVRNRMADGAVLEGAGFLEAKIRGRDTTKFLQVRHEQVVRILESTPHARLLLYDYNPVSVLDHQKELLDSDCWHPHFPYRYSGTRVTHAPVLPLALAAALNQYDDSLYSYCHSFAFQVCQRYFVLHDLDFTKRAVDAVKGFCSSFGAPRYIMALRMTPSGQELPEPFKPNDNSYGTLE